MKWTKVMAIISWLQLYTLLWAYMLSPVVQENEGRWIIAFVFAIAFCFSIAQDNPTAENKE
jgi:hypothetical protein